MDHWVKEELTLPMQFDTLNGIGTTSRLQLNYVIDPLSMKTAASLSSKLTLSKEGDISLSECVVDRSSVTEDSRLAQLDLLTRSSSNDIELEVQLHDKSLALSETGSGTPAELVTVDNTLFEEVRDSPALLHDDKESLLTLSVPDPINATRSRDGLFNKPSLDKLALLTPHELESMTVSGFQFEDLLSPRKEPVTLKGSSNNLLDALSLEGPGTLTLKQTVSEFCREAHIKDTHLLSAVLDPITPTSDSPQVKEAAPSPTTSKDGNRQFKCDVPGCKWSFSSDYKLKRHKETHTGRKDFTCPLTECRRKFTTLYNLNAHLKTHYRQPEILCPVENCGSVFKNRKELDDHVRERHTEDKAPYTCPEPVCGKRFFVLKALAIHMRTHRKEGFRILKCQWKDCCAEFDRPSHLDAHMRSHTNHRPFVCEFPGCQWSFRTPSKLKRHQRTHNNDRKFECPYEGCSKAFLRNEHLKQHLLSHQGQMKAFRCSECGAEFSARSTLYVHAKKHMPDAPSFKCPYFSCNKIYSGKSNLKRHIGKLHSPFRKPEASATVNQNQTDYIALLLGDDEEVASLSQGTPNTSLLTFVTVSQSEGLNDPVLVPSTAESSAELSIVLPEYNLSSSPTKLAARSARTHFVWGRTSKLEQSENVEETCELEEPTMVDLTNPNSLSPSLLQSQGNAEGESGEVYDVHIQDLPVVLLYDTTQESHSEYVESTINLRDLE